MRCCRRGYCTYPSDTCSGCVWLIVAQTLAVASSESQLILISFREGMLVSWEQKAQKSLCSVTAHILGLAETVPGSRYPLALLVPLSVWDALMIKQQGEVSLCPGPCSWHRQMCPGCPVPPADLSCPKLSNKSLGTACGGTLCTLRHGENGYSGVAPNCPCYRFLLPGQALFSLKQYLGFLISTHPPLTRHQTPVQALKQHGLAEFHLPVSKQVEIAGYMANTAMQWPRSFNVSLVANKSWLQACLLPLRHMKSLQPFEPDGQYCQLITAQLWPSRHLRGECSCRGEGEQGGAAEEGLYLLGEEMRVSGDIFKQHIDPCCKWIPLKLTVRPRVAQGTNFIFSRIL